MRRDRVCVLVNGLPGSSKSTLARALAADHDLPVLSKDAVKDFLASAWPREPRPDELSAMGHDALWALVRACPNGAVVETWFGPTGCDRVQRQLTEAGIDAGRVARCGATARYRSHAPGSVAVTETRLDIPATTTQH